MKPLPHDPHFSDALAEMRGHSRDARIAARRGDWGTAHRQVDCAHFLAATWLPLGDDSSDATTRWRILTAIANVLDDVISRMENEHELQPTERDAG